MSGLFGALSAAVQALDAHSTSVQIAGKNLANVNNASYARQRVVYGDRGTVATPLGAQSLGLEAKQIQQLRDFLLDRQVVRETSLLSSYQAEQTAYQNAQAGLGQSIDQSGETNSNSYSGNGSGISEAVTNFFNSFQSLAARPTDPGERQTLLQNAQIMTDRMQVTDSRLAQLQSDLTTQVTNDVSDANTILTKIANLNAEIGRYEINQPGSAVDLRDQRQGQLEELAKRIGIESVEDPNSPGQIQVFTRDAGGNQILLVNGANVTGPLTISGSTVSGGSPSTAIALSGGSIQGALNARDGGVQTLRDNLDALANELVTSVNAAYNPAGNTGDFFNASNLTAGTISIATTVTATNIKASDNGPAGDNTIAQAVANLATKTFSTASTPADAIDGTFTQHYSATVSNLGQALSGMNLQVNDQTNIQTLVKNQRDSVSGVSMDEELADLVKFQRAFQASSRVVSIIDDLLGTVVNLGNG